jgi:glucose/arabinose dehydrogenase
VFLTLAAVAVWRTGAWRRLTGADLREEPAPTSLPLGTVDSAAMPTAVAEQVPSPSLEETPAPNDLVATRVIAPDESLQVPPGFGVSVFAGGLDGPRMMALGPDHNIYVAERNAGAVVRLPDLDGDGIAEGKESVADDLDSPSSIAFFEDGSLYVGETTRVLRLSDPDDSGVFRRREVVVSGLPDGGHTTRTVLFSPDWTHLYVSVGSSCNVCIEQDVRRAAIVRFNPDGSGEEVYARGLRNAVGLTFRPGTDELWATNNGRDWLGDDLPPETVYVVRRGDDAGWPRCHSGRVEDPDFGRPGVCDGVVEPVVEIQAHSAPLGLTFYGGGQFPESYRGGLFVALHGSWNRSTPTGYKVVHVPIGDDGLGPVEDFVAGWLQPDGSQWGRPVDVLGSADGSLLVSDDGQGMIYRVFFAG